MTQAQLTAIVNAALAVAQEVAAMPVKTDLAIHRAIVASKAANDAINEFNAQRVYEPLIERLRAAA